MSAILLLLAVISFAVKVFDGHIGSLDLIALGLVFFAASFLVAPVREFMRRAP